MTTDILIVLSVALFLALFALFLLAVNRTPRTRKTVYYRAKPKPVDTQAVRRSPVYGLPDVNVRPLEVKE